MLTGVYMLINWYFSYVFVRLTVCIYLNMHVMNACVSVLLLMSTYRLTYVLSVYVQMHSQICPSALGVSCWIAVVAGSHLGAVITLHGSNTVWYNINL